jgi:hypothetical protein
MTIPAESPGTEDCFTIVGRYDDSGDATVTVVLRTADNADPHWAALRHTGALSEQGEFEVVAVLRGRCEVLATQQSLRLFAERLLEHDL